MLKNIIRNLISKSSRRIRDNGVIEYTFKGFVSQETREDILSLYREGTLNSWREYYCACADDCHVSFKFGQGASTSNYLWFSYVDERPLRSPQYV
jgi:hypothetical protein